MKNKVLLVSYFLMAFGIFASAQTINKINSVDANKMIGEDKELVILDVRTPMEFNQGHIKGAVNIDISQPGFYDKILKLDKSKSYLVYCRTQNRSGVTVNFMKEKGFNNIYQMVDGITGWNINGLPVEK